MSEQAIKAFMSVAGEADHGRTCLDCNYFPSGHRGGIADRAAHAEREARAILAVSEPVVYADGYSPAEYHGASDMRVSVLSRDYRGYACASDALAESLAAFVESSL